MPVHVAFTPHDNAAAHVGVVVDVIRASSSIAQALASGYERVLCSREIAGSVKLGKIENCHGLISVGKLKDPCFLAQPANGLGSAL